MYVKDGRKRYEQIIRKDVNEEWAHSGIIKAGDVLKEENFGCHPCVNTSSLRMKTADMIGKFLPAVGHKYKTVHLVGE